MIDKSIPLTDLHRHLDGNIRISTILALANKHHLPLPAYTEEGLKDYVQVSNNERDLVSFLAKLDHMVGVLADYDAVRRVAYENVEDAANAGIDYTELRFSPFYMAKFHHLNPHAVVEAVLDGITAGQRDFSCKVNLIGILSRTFGVQNCDIELAAILAYKDQITALDLAGDELGFPGQLFEHHFKQARDAGLHITAHAGEAAGAESIWHAIEKLGATRIGHGVKAIQDNALMEHMAKHDIGIESALTSNIQTSTVASYAAHPIKQFLAHGIKVSLNTDDPGVSGIELAHEYRVAAPQAGLTAPEIHQLQRNGLEMAFLNHDEKRILREQKSALLI
jgi:adenosine deaminase